MTGRSTASRAVDRHLFPILEPDEPFGLFLAEEATHHSPPEAASST